MVLLLVGIGLGLFNVQSPGTLRNNILRRFLFLLYGFFVGFKVNKSFLSLSANGLILAIVLGSGFLLVHLLISGGIKLRKEDLDSGLLKTSLLLYFLELPAEEFLYRLAILLPAQGLFGPFWAVLISTLFFVFLHIKTWGDKWIWAGSTVLGLSCGLVALYTNSVWAAVIVHNLNNFSYLTLVGKRNLFPKRALNSEKVTH